MKHLEEKVCTVCRRVRTLPDFLALPPPPYGPSVVHEMVWRNCTCGGTLTVLLDELQPEYLELALRSAA